MIYYGSYIGIYIYGAGIQVIRDGPVESSHVWTSWSPRSMGGKKYFNLRCHKLI